MAIQLFGGYSAVECCVCRGQFALTKVTEQARREDHKLFYCPCCGKSQYFAHQTEAEKQYQMRVQAENRLTAERAAHDQTRAARDSANRRLIATRGVITRTKNRVSKGVC